MKDTFKNFSSADYIQGACLTLDNAKRHLHASELLAANGNTGIAVSHLILAAEEYIKAFILLCLNGDQALLTTTKKQSYSEITNSNTSIFLSF
jgi:AbiV family abortive infection protein